MTASFTPRPGKGPEPQHENDGPCPECGHLHSEHTDNYECRHKIPGAWVCRCVAGQPWQHNHALGGYVRQPWTPHLYAALNRRARRASKAGRAFG